MMLVLGKGLLIALISLGSFMNISLAAPLEVTSPISHQIIKSEELLSVVQKELKSELNDQDVIITIITTPKEIELNRGEIHFNITFPYGLRYNMPTTVNINVLVDGRLSNQQQIKVDLHKFKYVVTTTRKINNDEFITLDMIELIKQDVGRLNRAYFTSLKDVIGKQSKRALASGTVLNKSMLELPIIIKRYKTINIVAKINGIEIIVQGEALQDGAMNDTIRVRNITSKKVITAKVVDGHTVAVITL